MIDPLHRWRDHGEKPDYAGLLTFGSLPWTENPADLAGVDVAVVGAPTDDLTNPLPKFVASRTTSRSDTRYSEDSWT